MNNKKLTDFAHELWAAAQTPPNGTITDAVDRIVVLLKREALKTKIVNQEKRHFYSTLSVKPNEGGGFRVTSNGFINPIPGSPDSFQTEEEAHLAIRVLEHADGFGGGPGSSNRFWDLWHRVSGVTQRGRAKEHAMAKDLGMRVVRTGRHTTQWVKI